MTEENTVRHESGNDITRITINMDRQTWIQLNVYGSILDVGCGENGWIFKDSIWKNIVHYADIDDRDGVSPFTQCDAHDLPFDDKSFDTVCINELLEHVTDPHKVIQQAIRVAIHRVVFTIPCEYDWPLELKPFFTQEDRIKESGKTAHELYKETSKDVKTYNAIDTHQAYHNRWFDDKSLLELLQTYKFVVWKLTQPGGWVHYVGVITP
jgi:SAM-dependent methyltransferase